MKSKPKTHVPLKNSSSKYFKKSKRIPGAIKRKITDVLTSNGIDANEVLEVRLVLKEAFKKKVSRRLKKLSGGKGAISPDEEFELAVKLIAKIAKRHKVIIKEANYRTRIIKLSGKLVNLEFLFHIRMNLYEYDNSTMSFDHAKTALGHHAELYIPREWKGLIHSVMGLRQIPLHPMTTSSHDFVDGPYRSVAMGKSPDIVAAYYNFPPQTDGHGQHIGIISCGGGFAQEEFDQFLEEIGLKNVEEMRVISIDGGTNDPNSTSPYAWVYNYEVVTDCLVACCAAPGAKISVYFCQNGLYSFCNAVEHILEEGDSGPDIISYSWGSSEQQVRSSIEGTNRILKEAALVHNKSIFCATGDFGSTNKRNLYPADLTAEDELVVVYPASSPWVTGCGGTMFEKKEGEDENEETVWNSRFLYSSLARNATGGGFSKYQLRPDYQKDLIGKIVPKGYINPKWIKGKKGPIKQKKALVKRFKPFRGVPDVAGYAAIPPEGTGYWIYFEGKDWIAGGTSAVAPLWAALTARLNQAIQKKVGFFNPILYSMGGSDAFTPILSGHNGLLEQNTHWEAGEPWNPCTGLGVPNGKKMLEWLQNNYTDLDETE